MTETESWFTVTDMEYVTSPSYRMIANDAHTLLQDFHDTVNGTGPGNMTDMEGDVEVLQADCEPVFKSEMNAGSSGASGTTGSSGATGTTGNTP
jgi:hypothetical protein